MTADEKRLAGLLSQPLSGDAVKERKQANRTLSYVEGWYVIQKANEIFGFTGWTRETIHMERVYEPKQKGTKALWEVGYVAKVRIIANGITREGTGFGSGYDKSLVMAVESAVKEAETDAMKRAFITFGDVFGLALYDKEQVNVDYGDGGRPEADEEEAYPPEMSKAKFKAGGYWEEFITDIRAANSRSELKEMYIYWRDKARKDGWPESHRKSLESEVQDAKFAFEDEANKESENG